MNKNISLNTSSLLIDDKVVMAPKKLIEYLGKSDTAIILQQIHYWTNRNKEKQSLAHFHKGNFWTYNTLDDWAKEFSWMSKSKITSHLNKLKDLNLIITDNFNKRKYDRTLWYRVNYEQVAKVQQEMIKKEQEELNAKMEEERLKKLKELEMQYAIQGLTPPSNLYETMFGAKEENQVDDTTTVETEEIKEDKTIVEEIEEVKEDKTIVEENTKTELLNDATVKNSNDFIQIHQEAINTFGIVTTKEKNLIQKDLKEFNSDVILKAIEDNKNVARSYTYVSNSLRMKKESDINNNNNNKTNIKTQFHNINESFSKYGDDLEAILLQSQKGKFDCDKKVSDINNINALDNLLGEALKNKTNNEEVGGFIPSVAWK